MLVSGLSLTRVHSNYNHLLEAPPKTPVRLYIYELKTPNGDYIPIHHPPRHGITYQVPLHRLCSIFNLPLKTRYGYLVGCLPSHTKPRLSSPALYELGMVAYAYNPSTHKMKTEKNRSSGHTQLYKELKANLDYMRFQKEKQNIISKPTK